MSLTLVCAVDFVEKPRVKMSEPTNVVQNEEIAHDPSSAAPDTANITMSAPEQNNATAAEIPDPIPRNEGDDEEESEVSCTQKRRASGSGKRKDFCSPISKNNRRKRTITSTKMKMREILASSSIIRLSPPSR